MKNFLKGFGLGFGLLVFFILGLVATKAYEIFIKSSEETITRMIQVTKSINYDTYLSYPRFAASKTLSTKEDLSEDEKAEITKTFEKILNKVQESKLCTGGSYMLQANMAYKDGLSIPSGYRFDSNFECKFNKDNIKNYQDLLNSLNQILENNKYIILNIPAIKSIVSEEVANKDKEELYKLAYEQSKNIANEYSSMTKKTCSIDKITYELNQYPARYVNSDIAYNVPIEKDTLQRLNATLVLVCK